MTTFQELSDTPKAIHANTSIIIGELPLSELKKMVLDFKESILWFCDSSIHDDFVFSIDKLERVNPSVDEIANQRKIDELLSLNYQDLPFVHLSNSSESNSWYVKTMELVSARIDAVFRARRTRNETGIIRQSHIFRNLPYYLKNRVPKEWHDLGKGSFALVVGAGPSLDITLPLLKSDLPRPIIIASDSSLRALQASGICPDFVVSIDPNKSVSSCTNPSFLPGIAILSSQSHPSWSESWGERIRYLSGRVLTEDWLAEKGVSKTTLLAANNAGLAALAFADFLSPSLIVTVGMDLSGGRGGSERYAISTGRSHIEINAAHFHEIPGNYEKTVLTPFQSDWAETTKLSRLITNKRPILNFTDRGAVLEGTTLIHPDDFNEMKLAIIENIKSFDPPQKFSMQKKALAGTGLEQILSYMINWCDYIWNSMEKMHSEQEKCKNLLNLLSQRDLALLLGDFSFAVMPLLNHEKTRHDLIDSAHEQLKEIIWTLEDAILRCNPSKDFLVKFFTERWD